MELIKKTVNNIFSGKLKHLSRFSVVGVANTAVDFLAFTLCQQIIGIGYTLSQVIGYSCGVLNSFIFNKRWTFKDNNSNKNVLYEMVQFIAVNAVSLLITIYAMKFLIKGMNLNLYAAKILVTLLAQVTNFFGYKLWVFGRGK
jgi:putative flippase GtrA